MATNTYNSCLQALKGVFKEVIPDIRTGIAKSLNDFFATERPTTRCMFISWDSRQLFHSEDHKVMNYTDSLTCFLVTPGKYQNKDVIEQLDDVLVELMSNEYLEQGQGRKISIEGITGVNGVDKINVIEIKVNVC